MGAYCVRCCRCMCLCLCAVSPRVFDPHIEGRDDIALDTLHSLHLKDSDIRKLYTAFREVDLDSSGAVSQDEFFAVFRIEDSEINRRIFRLCDMDKRGRLNFCEFACSIWNLLSLESESLPQLAFYLFDDDGSGTLEYAEIRHMIETIHNKSYEKNNAVRKLVEDLRKMGKKINVMQFMDWARKNPAICAPLIALQYRLRCELFGLSFWERLQCDRWNSGDQLAPNYIVKVTREYYQRVERKRALELLNREGEELNDITFSERQANEGTENTQKNQTTTDSAGKKILARQNASVAPAPTPAPALGEVLPDAPEEVPETIKRTLTRLQSAAEEDKRTDKENCDEERRSKRKKKKKRKKSTAEPLRSPKVKFLPPVKKQRSRVSMRKNVLTAKYKRQQEDELYDETS
mmetsp:Transcript_1888/g.3003  ORF Transcript_1888/g.3003 Transcript_1888/m.3003 type:complete len:405 (+) Transcript_1888:72-1286(+)